MFRAARWRVEKNKIKLVFKLQFRVTQVPQLGWDTLIVALVPLEVGKPTVKSEKAAIHNGSCRWENPIYETVKLIREPKTGKINEKIYQFFVSTGSSKTGFLGEATINFADYAETIKPLSLLLPLKAANSGAILHVTIQKIQDAIDGREVEDNGDVMVRSHGRTLQSQLRNCDTDEDHKLSNGTGNYNSTENGSSITRKAELSMSHDKTVSQHAESNGILRASSGSDAISASSLETSSGQDTPRELGMKGNNNTHQDAASFLSFLSNNGTSKKPTSNAIHSVVEVREHRSPNAEWLVSSAPDESTDGSTNCSEDALLKESSDISIEKLNNEIAVLARQAEVSELELQTLRKQIAKESRRGNDLLREVHSLKEERDALKSECEQLKGSKQHTNGGRGSNRLQLESGDQRYKLEEIKQELNYEKDLNANLRFQLQKTQESNSELILAVRDLEELLEQKNKETSEIVIDKGSLHLHLPEGNGEVHEVDSGHEKEEDEEQHELELLVTEHGDAKLECSLQQKILDLSSELEVYKKDNEELETQMEQLALDYEILKQENHDMSLKLEQSQLQEQLKMQYECASSLAVINELELHVESLEKELKQQAEAFEDDLAAVMHAKVEQEQRAVRAEAALRKTRWNNATTAERLQEEINRLSMQMSSTFEANEKLAMQALTEARELRLQKSHLEELLERASVDLELVKDRYEERLLELSNQIDLQQKQTEQLLQGLEDKSRELQSQKKSAEAKENAFSEEIVVLRNEMERLEGEKAALSEQVEEKEKLEAEIKRMKTSLEEMEILLRRGNMERNALESKLASLREEAEKPLKELNQLRQLKDEKESTVGLLQSEVETLKAQYNDLKHSLFEDELEKENLRKQVFQLRGDLRKKEDTISVLEKKLRDSSVKPTISDGTTKPTSRNNKAGPLPRGSKDVSNLREKIKQLEGELKQKEAALEIATHSFVQKENDLFNRIVELEKIMEEVSQNNSSASETNIQKDEKELENRTGSCNAETGRAVAENLGSEMGDQVCFSYQNGKRELIRSNNGTQSEKELGVSLGNTYNQSEIADLLSEMPLLKERNKTMEIELKEMEERYSEISVKFAEVEGERQKLVMTIRNLKNAKKN
ncbi:hypothetical protein AAC387_Pa11g0340 [Persea americana]